MKLEIKIPSLGESVSEATISSIMKPSGSYVKRDEEILEIETDKVNQVLYAPGEGAISLSVKVDDKVSVGQVIGFVDTDKVGSKEPQPKEEETKKPEGVGPQIVSKNSSRKTIDAFKQEINEPTKLEPRKEEPVSKAEVKASSPEKEEDPRFTRRKMTNLRKAISHKLVEAKNTTAMLTTFNEIDMSAVMELRSKEKESFEKKHGVKLGFMSFFVKAVVAALKAVPEVNAIIDGEDILQFHTYDIGVAVSTDKGLMVPVIRECDKLSFAEVEKAVVEFAGKAREGKISIDDLRGGSFTITNGGVFGSLLSTPILNTPQSAILGMHAIVKRPVAIGDKVEIRPMMYVALSYDHRLIDGKEAVQFLVHIKQILENPAKFFLES